MRAVHVFVAMLAMPLLAQAQDYKIIKLEQDVRRLEQQVRELSRQVTELRSRVGVSLEPDLPQVRETEAPAASQLWLQAKRWDRLHDGMNEQQVIEALGPPTTARGVPDGNGRILFYAIELAAGNFLGGSVTLRDSRVVQIEKPVLK